MEGLFVRYYFHTGLISLFLIFNELVFVLLT